MSERIGEQPRQHIAPRLFWNAAPVSPSRSKRGKIRTNTRSADIIETCPFEQQVNVGRIKEKRKKKNKLETDGTDGGLSPTGNDKRRRSDGTEKGDGGKRGEKGKRRRRRRETRRIRGERLTFCRKGQMPSMLSVAVNRL